MARALAGQDVCSGAPEKYCVARPEILRTFGRPEVAEVFVVSFDREWGRAVVECVDALDPRFSRSEKSVIIVSTQIGCQMRCLMCDAASVFQGNLSAGEILAQVELVMSRHPGGELLRCRKLKVHLARMGEPSRNPAALEVLLALPGLYPEASLLPVVATVAPRGSEAWFEELLDLKGRLYSGGMFQLQFSVNSTDASYRDRLMPFEKWGLPEMAKYGERWFSDGDRKVVLNFALAEDAPLSPLDIASRFDPAMFMVKITPVNPTGSASRAGLRSVLDFEKGEELPSMWAPVIDELGAMGFDVLLSVGSPQEMEIGSNCGQARLLWEGERAVSTGDGAAAR